MAGWRRRRRWQSQTVRVAFHHKAGRAKGEQFCTQKRTNTTHRWVYIAEGMNRKKEADSVLTDARLEVPDILVEKGV